MHSKKVGGEAKRGGVSAAIATLTQNWNVPLRAEIVLLSRQLLERQSLLNCPAVHIFCLVRFHYNPLLQFGIAYPGPVLYCSDAGGK